MSTLAEPITLSVMIPTYNRSGYLPECVGSLQKCGVPNLEIFVCDDGSTDDTEQVVQTLGANVNYFRQSNEGPAAARNRGFSRSRGRYVAFLDSDDAWLPGVAEHVLQLLDEHPEVDVVFTDSQMGNAKDGFQSWIEVAGQDVFHGLSHRKVPGGGRILERETFFRRMAERNAVFIGAVVMRREAFERAGQFDTELCGAADWELWLRMASQMTFAFWPESLAVYTRHLDNMSSDFDKMSHEFCMALKKVRQKCTWLSASEKAWIDARFRHHAFGYAYRAYDRGDYWLARQRFGTLLSECGPEVRGALYWLACALPFGLVGKVRRLKQAMGSQVG